VKNLAQTRLDFHVASMSDPRLMPQEERHAIIRKLKELGYEGYLEDERCHPYPTAQIRMQKAAGDLFRRED
jgi:hypothetical protein